MLLLTHNSLEPTRNASIINYEKEKMKLSDTIATRKLKVNNILFRSLNEVRSHYRPNAVVATQNEDNTYLQFGQRLADKSLSLLREAFAAKPAGGGRVHKTKTKG